MLLLSCNTAPAGSSPSPEYKQVQNPLEVFHMTAEMAPIAKVKHNQRHSLGEPSPAQACVGKHGHAEQALSTAGGRHAGLRLAAVVAIYRRQAEELQVPQAWRCPTLAQRHAAASALRQRNAVLGTAKSPVLAYLLIWLDAGGRPRGCGSGPRSNLPSAGAQGVSIHAAAACKCVGV